MVRIGQPISQGVTEHIASCLIRLYTPVLFCGRHTVVPDAFVTPTRPCHWPVTCLKAKENHCKLLLQSMLCHTGACTEHQEGNCQGSMTCFRLERGWASFNYLAGSETFSLGETDDGEAFRDTMNAMITVGLTQVVSNLAERHAGNVVASVAMLINRVTDFQ